MSAVEAQERLSLFNADKIIILLFVGFLLTGEAQELLYGSGLRWAYLLLLSFGIGYAVTPLVHLLAHRLGMLDIPHGRKAHKAPTALMGGLAIFLAFSGTLVRNFAFSTELKGIVLGGVLILAAGLIDDKRELSARLKLIVQLLAVGILLQHGVVISFLPPGLWGDIGEGLLTIIWVVGIVNAVNFLDGMDGLATGMCTIMATFFGLIAFQNGHDFMVYLALPLVGACLGFLPYNFRRGQPAAIFLGDAGSTFLGFMMASLGIMGDWASDYTARLLVPVMILGVPIFDMSFTTFMRIKNGQVRSFREWVDFTGRDHFHHRLADLRIGNGGAVVVIYIITFWLGLSALALKNSTGFTALIEVAESTIVFILMAFFMVFVPRQYARIEKEKEGNGESG